ncbi:dATP pyrophosphohydrolase [Rhodobacter veldkampii DSM 11550]|uniref:dATP pyrophosphohydrolase n=1 Tax=Phaeovulum veldkampii DSM 11550 TaxID=1185920 RepID=A0A2T4JGQ5_9RHOB|nr:SLC13 family permease [Phaeovulum veldkampii]MBK5947553.1 dATP pyrophosphohydrolase [Phaeovulum veldkampii DSM 11550]PTE16967.1 dATP pyrophosphohydrolase [Phaeovulum veldkampii DSM 11550]TDQ55996.1 di/tricarboxylate transporter [Phaeovulum veldkampii DSM 11550]
MIADALPPDLQALAGILIVAGMFVMFLREKVPPEVVAIGGAAVMLASGLLPYDQAVGALSNSAPWTIAFMFLIMGALVRTGALEAMTRLIEARVDTRPGLTVALLFALVVAASAVMNNTPVVAVMIPVFIQLAQRLGVAPSRYLMPLSYFTILGGMITLIGTSTNILVDGVAQAKGLAPFSIFEIAPAGLAVAAAGAVFIALFARRLVPERQSMGVMLSGRRKMKYFTEVALPEGSSLIGKPVLAVDIFRREGVRVIDVLRGDASLRRDLAAVGLQAGDRVVLRTEMAELLGMQQNPDLRMVDKLSSVQTETVEVLISPGCRMIGRSLGELRLRRRYGVYVLAAHRRNQNIGRKLDDLVVVVGDTLLLEGSAEDIARLAADMDLVDVARPRGRAFRRSHMPIAVVALLSVVGLSAVNAAPIMMLAMLAVAVILVTRCIDADEAFSFIDGRLLAMIFAMLAVGEGLEQAGSIQMIVDAVSPYLAGLPPVLALAAVYFMGLIMTELLSNNAVAVILAPIAIELARSLGLDPRPFAVAVMFAASVAFATPIGYQTHMMVYGPGGYRFTDFLRLGLPLDIITGIVACLVIPMIWPL